MMKNNILLVLLFFLIPIIINGQTQEATTSDGKKVILNADGTWKYAEEATTSDGKKVILNADGTWKYAEIDRIASEAAERKRIEAEQKRSVRYHEQNPRCTCKFEELRYQLQKRREAGGAGNQGVQTGSVDSKNRGEGGGLGTRAGFIQSWRTGIPVAAKTELRLPGGRTCCMK